MRIGVVAERKPAEGRVALTPSGARRLAVGHDVLVEEGAGVMAGFSEVDGVLHYCVANMPGAVPVSSTKALTNVTFPYIQQLADRGIRAALATDEGFAAGLATSESRILHEATRRAFDVDERHPEGVSA